MTKRITLYLVLLGIIVLLGSGNCVGDGPEINYEYGTFPNSVMALTGINSIYDDYNANIPQIGGAMPVMFSTNRASEGGEFDVKTGIISVVFNQVNGEFLLDGMMLNNIFYQALEAKMNTVRDQFGPYRFFNSKNGLEYYFVASENLTGDLDLMFIEYTPPPQGEEPLLGEPFAATRLNTDSDDAYICFDWSISNLYLTSNRNGDFDIFTTPIDDPSHLKTWLLDSQATMVLADSVNSSSDDKCPYIFDDIMVFTSDRPGGFGGFDLYYSRFVDGKWGSPVNFGPDVNSSSNEYRPFLGFAQGYTNNFMVFSSDRPGGLGGYDLYFTGVTFE